MYTQKKPSVAQKKPSVASIFGGLALVFGILSLVLFIILMKKDEKDENGGVGGGVGGGGIPTPGPEPTPEPTPCPDFLPAPPTCKAFQIGLNVGCEPPVTLNTIRPLTEDMIAQIRALFNDRVAYSSESNFQSAAKAGDQARVGFDFLISTKYDTPSWKASEIAQYALQGITANDPDLKNTVITVSSITDANLVANPNEKTIVTFYKAATPLPGDPGRTTDMPMNDRNTGTAYVRALHPQDKCYLCDP